FHLLDAMCRTLGARDLRDQNGLVLAGVQMPPAPLQMVVDRAGALTLRTMPRCHFRPAHVHVDFFGGLAEFNSFHAPRRCQSQDRLIKLAVVHRVLAASVFWRSDAFVISSL